VRCLAWLDSTPMSTHASQPGETQAINIEQRDHRLLNDLDTPDAAR
jgi:hypothetical protein